MKRPVDERDLKVHHRVSCQIPSVPRLPDTFLDGGYESTRDRAAEDLVYELKIFPAWQRCHLDLAVAELAVSARLLLVTAVRLGGDLDGLAIRDPGELEVDFDPEPSFELGDRDLDMQLPLSRQQ